MESQNECTEKGCSEQNGVQKAKCFVVFKKGEGCKRGGGVQDGGGRGLQRAKRGAGVGQKMGVGGVQRAKRGAEGTQRAKSE